MLLLAPAIRMTSLPFTQQLRNGSWLQADGSVLLFLGKSSLVVFGLLCGVVCAHTRPEVGHFVLTLAPILFVKHALLYGVVLLQTP